MKRREFLKKTSCGAAGFAVPSFAQASDEEKEGIVVRRYDMEIEVVEVGPKTRCHKKRYQYVSQRIPNIPIKGVSCPRI